LEVRQKLAKSQSDRRGAPRRLFGEESEEKGRRETGTR